MENVKNNPLIVGLLTLILGLMIGYYAGTNTRGNSANMGRCQAGADKGADYKGMHGAMRGMTMDIDGKSGDELDEAFLEGMIIHHEGAIEMAETLLEETERPELIQLGNDIITAQTDEIDMMEEWLTEWFE